MTTTKNTSDILCTVIVKGEKVRGIYTGQSSITGRHYVSFFNGSGRSFENVNDISFEETADGSAPERALDLICE